MDRSEPHRHASAGEWLAWMDGELPPGRRAELEESLGVCGSCRARRDDARDAAQTLTTAVSVLDAPPPRHGPSSLLRPPTRRHVLRASAAAAVLVLVLAGGILALGRQTSVRRWLEGVRGPRAFGVPAATSSSPTPLFSVVAPDSLDIVIEPPEDSTVLRVVRSGDRWLSVGTSQGGAPGVELGDGRLRIEPDAAQRITLVIPIHSRARIRTGGRTVLKLGVGPPPGEVLRDSITLLRLTSAGARIVR